MKVPILNWDISWSGFWFKYYGDELIYLWPWIREANKRHLKYRSLHLDGYYTSLNEYLISIGKNEASTSNKINNIKSYYWDTNILPSWIKDKLRSGIYVVLTNINAGGKPSSFWDAIPADRKIHFAKDVVVLHCKTMREMHTICNTIEESFANAVGVRDGNIVYWNQD